jgi:hypothetical protein
MVTVENNIGRLIEIRFPVPARKNDTHELQDKLIQLLGRMQGQVVICSQLAGGGVIPPEDMDLQSNVLRRDNPRVERAAMVIPPEQPMLALQIERLVRDANHPGRRLCRTISEAEDWLTPVLNGTERMRLRAFLQSWKPTGGSLPDHGLVRTPR